jgi:hypothetical protein
MADTRTQTHTQTCTHARTHTQAHRMTDTRTPSPTHTHTHTRIQSHNHTHKHTHNHTRTHTQSSNHAHTHTHTITHNHTHTHARPRWLRTDPTRCVATLMDVSLLTNYYNQRVLDRAYLAMRAGDAGARVRARARCVGTPEYSRVRCSAGLPPRQRATWPHRRRDCRRCHGLTPLLIAHRRHGLPARDLHPRSEYPRSTQ